MALYDKKVLKLPYNSLKGEKFIKLKAVTDVLHLIGKQWKREAQQLLKDGDKNASGLLSKSINYRLKTKGESIVFYMYAAPYGVYVDQGVQGAGPFTPPKNPTGKSTKPYTNRAPNSPFKFGSGKGQGSIGSGIRKWLDYRKIQFQDSRGRFMSYDATAGMMSKSVFRYGLEPFPFLQEPLRKAMRQYEGKLRNAFEADYTSFLDSKDYPTDYTLKFEV